ncbi:MAG: hypothetical protein D3904_14195 [Candidatus Electrothrix sp. EH2]|nr:hypothetical protein [Candidatus Electrothrix sp. EH2]
MQLSLFSAEHIKACRTGQKNNPGKDHEHTCLAGQAKYKAKIKQPQNGHQDAVGNNPGKIEHTACLKNPC